MLKKAGFFGRSANSLSGVLLLVLVSSLSMPAPLQAALGDKLDSVEADRVRMKATSVVKAATLYTTHELLTPQQTTIREYVSNAGVVFAVTWQGPFQPDLTQLFGAYVDSYKTAARGSASSRNRLSVSEPNLVVQAVGHMRAFSGRAYDPQLLPAGINIDEIQ
ncbi:MAG: DUF2844 domain-containing protein [Steroidobacteraceae bacterium]